MATYTAANSILTIGVLSIYPVAQQIQGFMTDDAFATESVEPVQVSIGVDGQTTAGFVPTLTMQTISLQAGSPSEVLFETWQAAQIAAQEVYAGFGILSLPGPGKRYVLSNGYLTQFMPMPTAKKVVQGRNFRVTWGTVQQQPF